MKWDYYTYLKQPKWFIDGLFTVKNIDAEIHNIKERQNKKRYG